ncbi:GNAT family N-acetyltransferase [Actinoplanes sp. CA-131856]
MRASPVDVVREHPGTLRWRAVLPPGIVAGAAEIRTVLGVDELRISVKPPWRRLGIGSRLLDAVREQAGARRLLADVAAGSPAEAFCRRQGFRRTGTLRHALLTYGDVHQAWLGELIDAEHPGYALGHWTGGPTVLTAAEADGGLVAYALAVVRPLPRGRARQVGPAVLGPHHGRRLGLWVNAALIERLRLAHPHIREIETAAAEDDSHLIAAHEELGFRLQRRSRRYELTLS